MVVDGALKAEVREPPGPVRALHLTSQLVLGQSLVSFMTVIIVKKQQQNYFVVVASSCKGLSDFCEIINNFKVF